MPKTHYTIKKINGKFILIDNNLLQSVRCTPLKILIPKCFEEENEEKKQDDEESDCCSPASVESKYE